MFAPKSRSKKSKKGTKPRNVGSNAVGSHSDEIYDAVDSSISIKSGEAKKIPLEKMTQRVDRRREEEDPYTYDDAYGTVKMSTRASRSVDSKAVSIASIGKPTGAAQSDSVRSAGGRPRRMIRRPCFYATCSAVIILLLMIGTGLAVGSYYFAEKMFSLEKRLHDLQCGFGEATILESFEHFGDHSSEE